MSDVDSLNVREKMVMPKLPLPIPCCCASCCWFCYEDTEGDGLCMNSPLDTISHFVHCSDNGCGNYFCRALGRHYMAVLLQRARWMEDKENRRKPDDNEIKKALQFAYKHIRYSASFKKRGETNLPLFLY